MIGTDKVESILTRLKRRCNYKDNFKYSKRIKSVSPTDRRRINIIVDDTIK